MDIFLGYAAFSVPDGADGGDVSLSAFPEVVVVYFNAEDDETAYRGDEVRDEQENAVAAEHDSLNHEADAPDGRHQERRQGNVVGLSGTHGADGLGQIAQNQADAGYRSADVEEKLMFHNRSFYVLVLQR